jgi:hypothetical protein
VGHSVNEFSIVPDTVGGILMAVGSLFAWLGPSMIIANQLVSAVPAARRALDREAAMGEGMDRASANRRLLRITYYLVPAGVLLAVAGVMLPW